MSTGLVLFGHGARNPRQADSMTAIAARVAALSPARRRCRGACPMPVRPRPAAK